MKMRATLKLPKEHGAWAMLYVPLAVGALVACRAPLRLLLLALSVTFFFIARESLLIWWRARGRGKQNDQAQRFMLSYLALAGLFGAPLLLVYHLYWFFALALGALMLLAINARQAVRHQDRTIGAEMMAIAGLTLTAPAAYYAASGTFDARGLSLWALCGLYFASSVFYVKLRVSAINPRSNVAVLASKPICPTAGKLFTRLWENLRGKTPQIPAVLMCFELFRERNARCLSSKPEGFGCCHIPA